jgi:hypothetical protein
MVQDEEIGTTSLGKRGRDGEGGESVAEAGARDLLLVQRLYDSLSSCYVYVRVTIKEHENGAGEEAPVAQEGAEESDEDAGPMPATAGEEEVRRKKCRGMLLF